MRAPSLLPGRYFRMHMVGYFEGIDSERGIVWRCSELLFVAGLPSAGGYGDGVDGAPNGISVPRWSLSSTHLKGSRPWASLSLNCRLSRVSGSIWRRTRSKSTASTRRARSSSPASCGAARWCNSSPSLPPCVVAMEACSSAHHWGRQLLALGIEVKLIPPAHVKPYVRRNKNDAADAAAICEAAGRPGQRFVPVRSIDNQAELMRHRARELARRPAHLAAQRLARAYGRDRGRRAAGRAARL